jgi:osmoprotectant transport system substrate-binding protein
VLARLKAVLVLVIILAAGAGAVAGALTVVDRMGGKRDRIVVGSKAFTESIILGEIVSQWLEQNGVPVERRFNLGATNISFQAIRTGAVDLYAEYTGTGLIAILHHAPMADRSRVFETVRAEFEKDYGIRWLAPLGFNNSYALAMPSGLASKLGITKISDLLAHPELRAGFASEFFAREDGWPGLQKAYDLHFRSQPSSMEAGLMYQAAANQQLDVVSVYSTDGRIQTQHLLVLEDDREFFPPYEAAIMARADALVKNPRVEALLSRLRGSISDDEMRRMNAEVDFGSRSVADVARTFLAEEALASKADASAAPVIP